MPKTIDKRIVAAIKDRDARTDRYGEDLVFLVVGDLKDREYVHKFMPEHKAGCRMFEEMDENEQFRVVREVLNEPEPKRAEAAAELVAAMETPAVDSREQLDKLIERIEQIVPYVTATLGRGNTFTIQKMEGYGDPKDWVGVHAGRARSSEVQLDNLLKEARALKR